MNPATMILQGVHEVNDGKPNMGEVGVEHFIAWYHWKMMTNPDMGAGIPLNEFDIESAVGLFEEWIIDQLKVTRGPVPEPQCRQTDAPSQGRSP